ncbi:FxDxF family PEP-CTERM protein [Candidatus Symbiobacter mobilis]|uniref:Ice-binding protein C-terminal domain-containing protein n=1 Tax=Candidatus Symbiobacter mobilis CR TaxID=946483 RepID=U5NBB4_9BURK|nr:FxDxF family PEP-CTERM protein [Candidatus Symbiobacter mobilis]AGX87464.1 hypothetical protein Cenrod_1377 [Candidatus Symbiobacter mobilis CR]
MKLKNVVAAAVLAVGALVGGHASASVTSWVSGGDQGEWGSWGGGTFFSTGDFVDTYTFNAFSTPWSAMSLSVQGWTLGTVSDLNVYLDDMLMGSTLQNLYTGGEQWGANVGAFNFGTSLTSGAHTLVLKGKVDPLSYTANYFGNYSVVVAPVPVPEPESYAMLLAGLGVVGAVVRRRQRHQSSASKH